MNRYSNFGKQLRTLRKKQGLTQVELARKIGVHGQYISNAERGMSALPPRSLRKLVKTVGGRSQLQLALIEDATIQAAIRYGRVLGA